MLHASETEKVVIGTLIAHPQDFVEAVVRYSLHEELFFSAERIKIFQTMQKITSEGFEPDLFILCDRVSGDHVLVDEIHDCYNHDRGTMKIGFDSFVTILKEKYEKRILYDKLDSLKTEITDNENSVDQVYGKIDQALDEYFKTREESVTLETNADIILGRSQAGLREKANSLFAKSRLTEINDGVIGYPYGKHSVIAARPGIGKTTLVCNEIPNFCSGDYSKPIPTAFNSQEMDTEEILSKIACEQAGLPYRKYLEGKMNDLEKECLEKKLNEIVNFWPLYIQDRQMNEWETCNWMRMMKYKHGVKIVIHDYLQLIRSSIPKAPRREQVGNISSSITASAKRTGQAVISTAQLKRPMGNEDWKPKLSDLKEAGEIEENAYLVALLSQRKEEIVKEYLDPYMIDIAKFRGFRDGDPEKFIVFDKRTGVFTSQESRSA